MAGPLQWSVRVTGRDARGATGQRDTVQLAAASPGSWGNRLRIHVDHDTRPENGAEELFNLTWLSNRSRLAALDEAKSQTA
jgi:hypothetical protein